METKHRPGAQVDNVRTLYGKFLEHDPTDVRTWLMLAELEAGLHETERARAVHELALSHPVLNQPELLWMHFIDFEIAAGERAAARALYERLLERTQHVKARSIATFFCCPLARLPAWTPSLRQRERLDLLRPACARAGAEVSEMGSPHVP